MKTKIHMDNGEILTLDDNGEDYNKLSNILKGFFIRTIEGEFGNGKVTILKKKIQFIELEK